MPDRKQIEKRFWDRFATSYDRFIAFTLGDTYSKLVTLLKEDLRPEAVVLEVATGTGLLAFEICRSCKSLTGVDISEQMIRVANQNLTTSDCTNLSFEVQDAYRLSFSESSFDVVIASNVLHLLQEPEVPLQEMKRVLKHGGKLVLPTFCHGEDWKSRTVSALMSLAGFRAENKWSTKEFEEFVVQCGFNVQKSVVIKDVISLTYLVVTVS